VPPNPRLASLYSVSLKSRDPIPLIRGWNRLEGRPRSADFERSLRAEVRDPVWFLTRQWQYGEFEGEDAGSPVDARLAYENAALDSCEIAGRSIPYDAAVPLETCVESEAPSFDLMLHMQVARVFERLLQDRARAARLSDYASHLALDYPAGVDGADTAEAQALFSAGKSFLFDAERLIAAVRDGTHAALTQGFAGITPAETSDLVQAGNALVEWYERVYAQPTAATSAWDPERLDYRFACNAATAGVRFEANAYDGTELDWYAFDVAHLDAAPAADPTPATALSFLPTSIRFAGMPSARYWEMEDGTTDFGALDINTNDLAKLLLTEFMLLYSNDWCVLPLELPVGSFTRIQGLVVTDVFGDQTLIRPADRGPDSQWQRWSMFRLNGDETLSPGLLLAPAITAKVVAPALEEVRFLRDEMANLVWGVEHRVMSKVGEAMDPEIGHAAPVPPATAAEARYALGTTVPNNWRPFLPTHVPGSVRSIRLQRGRMPSQPGAPLGEILSAPAPYFIAEEEIPRAGRIVDRAYQRARWIDGASFLWLGRSTSPGRGEGLSGLIFDQIEEHPNK
jgi:hypothetical protein